MPKVVETLKSPEDVNVGDAVFYDEDCIYTVVSKSFNSDVYEFWCLYSQDAVTKLEYHKSEKVRLFEKIIW